MNIIKRANKQLNKHIFTQLNKQMNKDRRKEIERISSALEDLQADITAVKDEEQEYFDNMPEALQGGEKGSKAEEVVSILEEAENQVQEAIDSLGNASE